MATTIEIDDELGDRLETLVEETGASEAEILERALEALEEKRYAERFQADFADLRARGDAWDGGGSGGRH